MENKIFLAGVYAGAALSLLIAISGAMNGTAIETLMFRAALALAAMSFLGWAAARIISQVPSPKSEKEDKSSEPGGNVDVVLPSTDDAGISQEAN